jgi:hypothetical protein
VANKKHVKGQKTAKKVPPESWQKLQVCWKSLKKAMPNPYSLRNINGHKNLCIINPAS